MSTADTETEAPAERSAPFVGQAIPRLEDAALLTGQARFIDDLEPVAGLRHAAILRSPHAHARICSIDVAAAEALPGVQAVVTGAQVAEISRPIPSVVKTPTAYYPIAVDKVRYFGEPVAVVVAKDRYLAEDALDLIRVDYEVLAPSVDLELAMQEDAPVLHEALGSNIANERTLVSGDPDAAFETADKIVELGYRFPKYASTPIETYGVIAHHQGAPDRFTVWSNFQGPFVLHPLMCGALGVAGNRLRLISPQASGGSFGIKQGVFAYIVLLCAVSRVTGVPVKWTEDRLEHLMASSSATDRIGHVAGAFSSDGELLGLKFRNICNMGAYLRAPEPASVYRMQATSNGCYKVRDIAVENILVVTNQMPTGLNRGFGGPQFYFALERLMDLAAGELGIDAAALRQRNFVTGDQFPYECPGGSILDSGNFTGGLDEVLRLAGYEELLARRDRARAEGRTFGIGFACGVEPSGSNMGYVSLAQTAEERGKSEPKSGANTSATISMDPSGSVTVQLCSTPNGQGHATVAAQIVADRLGLTPAQIDVVTEIDTRTNAWSIASGNYANRFAAAVVDAVARCASQVAGKLTRIAAQNLECDAAEVELVDGHARVRGRGNRSIPVRRLAAAAHWNPAGLPENMLPGIYETAIFSPAKLTAPDDQDRVSSAVTYGAVFDLAAVEVDRATGKVTIDKYVSVHDVGTMLNPLIIEGQVWGGFVHGLGGAMFEQIAYDAAGNLLSGTFADYMCPTAPEIPKLTTGHVNTPSPHTELGAKGLGDGSSMLTPAALANAVSDALGVRQVELPLTLDRVWQLANGRQPQPTTKSAPKPAGLEMPDGALTGEGSVELKADRQAIWDLLLDPASLKQIIPGCETLVADGADAYDATVRIGIAGIKGTYEARVEIRDQQRPNRLVLVGSAKGALGHGHGTGLVELVDLGDGRTRLTYRYGADVGGKVASVGQRMMKSASNILIKRFFDGLQAHLDGDEAQPGVMGRLRGLFGGGDGS